MKHKIKQVLYPALIALYFLACLSLFGVWFLSPGLAIALGVALYSLSGVIDDMDFELTLEQTKRSTK